MMFFDQPVDSPLMTTGPHFIGVSLSLILKQRLHICWSSSSSQLINQNPRNLSSQIVFFDAFKHIKTILTRSKPFFFYDPVLGETP